MLILWNKREREEGPLSTIDFITGPPSVWPAILLLQAISELGNLEERVNKRQIRCRSYLQKKYAPLKSVFFFQNEVSSFLEVWGNSNENAPGTLLFRVIGSKIFYRYFLMVTEGVFRV